MKKVWLIVFALSCFAAKFPDLGGVLDFSKPEKISDRVFILTNPKSGSHVLLYSLMKVTGRPLRGRLHYDLFLHDPNCLPIENMMGHPLDFTKPTTYWGHEYNTLSKLNHSRNKLIFILRDYRENISSRLRRKHGNANLDKLFLHEITHEGEIFKEYIDRLKIYNRWNKKHRHLVHFNDLLSHPEIFLPKTLTFIGDTSDPKPLIDTYPAFQSALLTRYSKKGNRTGAGTNPHHFSKNLSPTTQKTCALYIRTHYPRLYRLYLKQFW